MFGGQTMIVTGAGSGIGRCVVHELASLGAHVAMVGRRIERLETVRDEVIEDGGSCEIHSCDIRDEDGVAATVGKVLANNGRIDALVNNAGGQYRSEMKKISTKGFSAVVNSNLIGGFIFMREVYNRWMEDNGGVIVNMIADISNGWPNFAHSGAARGGMLTLSESAASEWAGSGVRVNTVAPGAIASSGLDTYDDEHTEFIQRQVVAEIPQGRFGNEAEVSAAIAFLLSPAAAFINGSCIRIDGAAPNARPIWGRMPPPRRVIPPFDGFHRAKPPEILAKAGKED